MSSYLSVALDFVLDWEGGFSDDPDDPGGRTRFGISEAAHPQAWEDGPPTEADAHRIYHDRYWLPLRCGDIHEQRVATYVMDIGVNQGRARAGTILQRACNILGENLKVDGAIGPKTLDAANDQDEDRLIHVMVALRAEHHTGLAAARSRYKTFIYGWLRRDYAILEVR